MSLSENFRKLILDMAAQFQDIQAAQKDYQDYHKLHAQFVSQGPGLMALTAKLRPALGPKEFSPYASLNEHPQIKAGQFHQAVSEVRDLVRMHSGEILLEEPSFAQLACSWRWLTNTLSKVSRREGAPR